MIVIIDNQDSFTYNLVHYFEQLDPAVKVFQNTAITAAEIKNLNPDLIVLSPGPGKPAQSGASKEVLTALSGHIPIIGVCLGHQAIIEHFGGRIVKGGQPMHGKVSYISHDKIGVFRGISAPSPVVRYHSLVADKSVLPDCLTVTAEAKDGAIMGVRHKTLPITGIQFHPESVLTAEGFQMLQNIVEDAKKWKSELPGGNFHEQSILAF